MNYFSPHFETPSPCWWCRWFRGMDASGTLAICGNPTCCRCRTQPETGCAAFVREPGADDEPEWSPREQGQLRKAVQPIGDVAAARRIAEAL